MQFHGGIICLVYGTIHPIHLMDVSATSYTAATLIFSRVRQAVAQPMTNWWAVRHAVGAIDRPFPL
ncbi:MAG TPA: hypothetical protein DDZ61_05965, partial [Aeromonas salmonicida]|nr:hypothetical protein [Aeromonas salmonicida]